MLKIITFKVEQFAPSMLNPKLKNDRHVTHQFETSAFME